MTIRYIRVEKNAAVEGDWHLHFAELEAYNNSNVNVALNKTSRASSEAYGGTKELANDGNTNGLFANGSIWHSANDTNGSWWEVDLGSEEVISTVKIYNRTDSDYYKKMLDGVEIKLLKGDRTVEQTFTFNYNSGNLSDPLNEIQEFTASLALDISSIVMEDIINPNTTGTLTITFNQSIGEANLNANVTLNPTYIGTIGDITSADGGTTYTGTVTRTSDMNRLENKVNLNYGGITGEALYDVMADSSLLLNLSQIGSDIAGMSSSITMSDNGDIIAVSNRSYEHSGLTRAGITTVYKNISGTWTQLGNAFLGTQENESLGHYTILSGDGTRITISSDAYFNNTLKGSVKVYDWNGTNWVQIGSKLEGNTETDRFGWGTDMSKDGNTLVVGAFVGGNYVKVYSYDVGTSDWVQKGSTVTGSSEFGKIVSISRDGNTIMIGNTTEGKVYTYNVGTSDWVQKGNSFTPSISYKLSGDGEMVAITTETSSSSKYGTVKVYEWDGSSWIQKGNDINGDLLETTGFGLTANSLNIKNENGIKLIISEYQRQNSGRVNIYEWDGTNWVKKLNIDGTQNSQELGYGLDMSRYGEQVVISSALEVTRVYNITPTIERTILSMSMNDTTIKFPETGATFEIKYSTNEKTIGEVQGGLTLEPITAGTLTNVTMGNNGFSLVGTYNAATQTETTGNKLKYSEEGLSAEVEFILSTAEKAISNICFTGDAKVLTSEGYMEIREVKRGMKVQGEEIEEVTRTISNEKEVVLMKKGSIMKNMPNEDMVITKEHKVLYKGEMVEAKKLVNGRTIVYDKYKGDTLYNILLSGEGKMVVNGMIVETLSPSNNIAKLYKMLKVYKEEEKSEIIKIYNEERDKKKRKNV
jgi:hypothetical protein